MVSVPAATFYWSHFVGDIDWKKVWPLPQKFLLTNKVKEVTFELIHRFYPVKHFLQKLKSDIDVNCSFCESHPETCSHLFGRVNLHMNCGKMSTILYLLTFSQILHCTIEILYLVAMITVTKTVMHFFLLI